MPKYYKLKPKPKKLPIRRGVKRENKEEIWQLIYVKEACLKDSLQYFENKRFFILKLYSNFTI